MISSCMTMFDPTQVLGQGQQSPHSGGQLYRILHTHQNLAPSDYHLFGPMKKGLKGKDYVSVKKVKTTVMKWLKDFYEAGIHTFILEHCYWGKTITMLRSRDVIHRGPASFWCVIHVSGSVIILVLKKKALVFDSPSWNEVHSPTSTQPPAYKVGEKWAYSFT